MVRKGLRFGLGVALAAGMVWAAALAAMLSGSPALAAGPLFPPAQYGAGPFPGGVAAGDLNGDGWIDLATSLGSTTAGTYQMFLDVTTVGIPSGENVNAVEIVE